MTPEERFEVWWRTKKNTSKRTKHQLAKEAYLVGVESQRKLVSSSGPFVIQKPLRGRLKIELEREFWQSDDENTLRVRLLLDGETISEATV